MEWNTRRITSIVENALLEDRATRDATSYACIDPNQRAIATILAKQDCILYRDTSALPLRYGSRGRFTSL